MSLTRIFFLALIYLTPLSDALFAQLSIAERLNGGFEMWESIEYINNPRFLSNVKLRGTAIGWYPESVTHGGEGDNITGRSAMLTDLYQTGTDMLTTVPFGGDPIERGIPLGDSLIQDFSIDYQFASAENAVYTNLIGIGRVTIYRQDDGGTIDTVGTGVATLDGESRALERIVTSIQYKEDANLTDLYASVAISFSGERTEIPLTCADCLILIMDDIEFTVSDNVTSNWEPTNSDHQFKVLKCPQLLNHAV